MNVPIILYIAKIDETPGYVLQYRRLFQIYHFSEVCLKGTLDSWNVKKWKKITIIQNDHHINVNLKKTL